MIRLAEVAFQFYSIIDVSTQVSLAVLIMAVLCKHQCECGFALLSQTIQLMLIPSYMGAAMLFAHPYLGVSLMSCLGGLYFLTRGVARLLTRGFAKDRCPPKDKVALKRARKTRKKLAKTRRCDIFHYGSRRVLLKEAGFKISGLTWLPSGLKVLISALRSL